MTRQSPGSSARTRLLLLFDEKAVRSPWLRAALAPAYEDDGVVPVHRRGAEGRRLARRARAAAIERGELREALARMAAIAAVERALWSAGRAARALQRLSLS
jgi:hypothetical protein